jgi:hypothetical protein
MRHATRHHLWYVSTPLSLLALLVVRHRAASSNEWCVVVATLGLQPRQATPLPTLPPGTPKHTYSAHFTPASSAALSPRLCTGSWKPHPAAPIAAVSRATRAAKLLTHPSTMRCAGSQDCRSRNMPLDAAAFASQASVCRGTPAGAPSALPSSAPLLPPSPLPQLAWLVTGRRRSLPCLPAAACGLLPAGTL